MSAREAFLKRVRESVAAGNQAGRPVERPQRGGVGYQGGGADLVLRFTEAFKVVGGFPHVVPTARLAVALIQELLDARKASRVLLGRGQFIESLSLERHLQGQGRVVNDIIGLDRDARFAADVSVSGVDYLIAETGSLVVCAEPEEPHGLTLLPPIHVAVAHKRQILPDLFDLFTTFQPHNGADEDFPIDLPSCLTLITGPSKTGDIELKLVTGVHGPGEVHVVVVDGEPGGEGL